MLLVLFAVMPALVLLSVAAGERRRIDRQHAVEDVVRLASAAAATKDLVVAGTYQLLSTLAQVDAVRACDSDACVRLFRALHQEHRAYANFGLVRADGRFVASVLPGWESTDASDRSWFRRVMANRAFAAGDYQIGRLTHKATVNFAYPVLDGTGAPASVLFVALDLEWFGRMGAEMGVPEGGTVLVTDTRGTVLTSYPPGTAIAGEPLPHHAELVAAGGAPVRLRAGEGGARICASVRLGAAAAPSGYLTIGIDEEQAVAEADLAFVVHLAGLVLVGILSLLAAWFGGDVFILRRIRSLLAATRRVRDGDLSARCPASGQAGELDELATAFNGTVGALQRREEEQRRALEAQREAETRYRGLIDISPDAILVVKHGAIAFANAAARKLLGETEGAPLEGRRILDVVHPDTRGEAEARLGALRDGENLPLVEQRFIRLDGGTVQVEFAAAALVHDGGPATLLLVRDVTARRLLEEQFRRSQKLEAVGQLAGGVAHDFNNLLTVILGYCQLLRAEVEATHPFREELEEIHRAAESAARLTGQLLAFSRKQMSQPRLLDLNESLKGLDRMLRRLLPEDIRVSTVLAAGMAPVRVDPGHLEQVIMNLVVNARDAMPNGGHLTLETGNAILDDVYAATHDGVRPGRYAMIAVSDTGVGMEAETRRRAFEPFFTTKGPGRGTGLGLSTVYGIVKQAGGDVWLYSEPGHGTTFKIYLPAAGRAAEAATPPLLSDAVPGGSETILLVEDEDAVRKLAVHALRSRGYDVIEARNGQEALAAAGRHAGGMALVVSDVVMPHLGGPDLVERLRAARPELRALFMSGYTDNAMVRTDDPRRGVAFLGKPFTLDALVRKVRDILDAPAAALP
jgi:PAS domain S-box-containing protein